MKTKITLIFFFIYYYTLPGISQTILSDSSISPAHGDLYVFKDCDNGTTNVGMPGVNQIWDLSSLVNTSTVTLSCVSNSGTPFPNANFSVGTSAWSRYYYASSNSLELVGSDFGSGPLLNTYLNTEKLLEYPFQLGDSFVDSFYLSMGTPMWAVRFGNSNVLADGYGTLILPNGTFTDVLRVKTVQSYKDSVPGFSVDQVVDTQYFRYKPGNHQAIAAAFITVTNNVNTERYAYYLQNVINSVKDIHLNDLAKITVYPNPSSSYFSVTINNEFDDLSFSLSDISGRLKKIEITQKSSNEYLISPIQIKAGYYVLSILKKGKIIGSKRIQFLN